MMNALRAIPASVVGMSTDTRWGQVLQTPHAYGVVEVQSSDGVARTRGIRLLTKLTQLLSEPPASLAALSAVADRAVGDDVVSLILLVPVGATLYLVSRGKGCVYLKRGNKFARLLTGAQALSGDVRPGDTVIAATSGFMRALTAAEIVGAFDHLPPLDVAEKLTIRLHERAGGEGGAALIFRMEAPPRAELEPAASATLPPLPLMVRIRRKILRAGRAVIPAGGRSRIRAVASYLSTHQYFSPKYVIPAIVLLLFLVSVVLGIRKQVMSARSGKLTEVLAKAEHAFEEGMALMELNPVKGRERITEARDLLSPIVVKKDNAAEAKKVRELYEQIAENLTRAMQVFEVTPELYFDMSLLKAGAQATDVSLFEDRFGILDARGKTLFTVGAQTKNAMIVGGGEAAVDASQTALYGDRLYVLTKAGIHYVRLTDKKPVLRAIPPSPEWGTIADMAVFGGNVYLLDTAKSRIWKYIAVNADFSQLYEYLNPDTLPDLSQATTMAIDGSVWLGTATGRVLRFTGGKENSFTPQGLDVPLGSTTRVFTSDETSMVYVLDSERNRVVVLDKDGLYRSQYTWDAGFRATGVFASEKAGKLFLVRDGKIYVVPMK